MTGLDVRAWKMLDWAAALVFIATVLIPAVNAAIKDAPELVAKMPDFLSWPYLPAVLLVFPVCVIIYRSTAKVPEKTDETPSNLPPRAFPQIQFEPPSEFKLLPQQFTVDLAAQLPNVEVRFFVTSFFPRPIVLQQAKLSLQLSFGPALERIPLDQEDFEVRPKESPIVRFSRNLTDPELKNIPWRAGRHNASFALTAKAKDGDQTLTYGPVASMVIDGWVNAPPPQAKL